ncbi:MAG: hypothetical protein BAJALOKI3v1_410032 [Promethearchaeota archaeon]|nr:MAG: hypothetical protein BAJALOKI3v1_410032 [Candidatus Lokiarchaeota archaeon]
MVQLSPCNNVNLNKPINKHVKKKFVCSLHTEYYMKKCPYEFSFVLH